MIIDDTKPIGRPKAYDSTFRVAASIPKDLGDAIETYCAEEGIQKAEFFRRAASRFLSIDVKWVFPLVPPVEPEDSAF